MISGITILCFAASYAVALALEVSRLLFRSGVRGALMLGFGGAGFLAHTAFLGYRAAAVTQAPLSSPFDWYLVAAWALAGLYLGLTVQYSRTPVGLFILPLVLGLIGVARFLADQQPFARGSASQFWGMIHGAFLLLGVLAVLAGSVAGLMLLVQSYRLKHKMAGGERLRLPSLESLERAGARLTMAAPWMLALGFLSGVILNQVNHHRQLDDVVPWNDPVVWSFTLLLAWATAAALFCALYKPARQGRKVAYLTLTSFLFLLLWLGIRLSIPSEHGVSPVVAAPLPSASQAGGRA
jgi:ABC-type uncharacterized transport system permease subunit